MVRLQIGRFRVDFKAGAAIIPGIQKR